MGDEINATMDPAEASYLAEMKRYNAIYETILASNSPIQQFYEGAVILITGGSGFLGKQLIQKLLVSCKIKKIYLLMRTKKQRSLQERVNDIVSDDLFEHLRQTQSDFTSKLIPINGDITEIRLGLSEEDWTLLSEEVDIIFHGAATVNFMAPLKVATITNVRGTREILKLAKDCKKLKSFVHVSTAYVPATSDRVKQTVLEEFYESPISPELLIDLAERMDVDNLNAMTPHLLNTWLNTYTFTKTVAEELVRTMGKDLPICIVRPGFVFGAYLEPPGWADKGSVKTSITGFLVGACLGGLHVALANGDTIVNVVPVDIVNNATIVAAHEAAVRRMRGEDDIKIYTISSSRRPFTITKLHTVLKSDKIINVMTPKLLWYPYSLMTESRFVFFLLSWLLHFIPGYIVDGFLILFGKRAKIVKLFDKAYKQNTVYRYLLCNEWDFNDRNLLNLSQNLCPEDKIMFNCDVASIDLEHYIFNCALGARKYIFKDGLQNTAYGRKKYFWFRALNPICLTVYAYFLYKMFYLIYGVLCYVFNSIFSF